VFLTSFKADNDRSPWGGFWFNPVSKGGYNSQYVTADTAVHVTAVFSCVAVLSESFAILPPILYKQNGRNKDRITNHWVYKLLAKKPNRYQNAFEWREMGQGHLALRGNFYNEIYTNSRGQITELMPIHPDKTTIKVKQDGNYVYEVTRPNGQKDTLTREEVFHIRGFGSDIYKGYNPIEIAREAIGIAQAQQSYGSRFFDNDAKPSSGVITHPGSFKDTEAKRLFREGLQEQQAGFNKGKFLVLEMGMDYKSVGISNTDAQFLENRKFSVEEIARLFRVPPHRIGHLERSTNNNIEHQGLEFVTYTMTPWAERWEAAIESDLIPEADEIEIEFDFKRLLRGDQKSRSAYYHAGVLDGWMTRNEAREEEGYNPIDGLDEPLRPLNMMPEEEAEEMHEIEKEKATMEPENEKTTAVS